MAQIQAKKKASRPKKWGRVRIDLRTSVKADFLTDCQNGCANHLFRGDISPFWKYIRDISPFWRYI